jgi:HEAT repeat protein
MKRVYIAIAVLAFALVGVVGWQVAHPRDPEPLYKGKPLSEWLIGVKGTPDQLQEARESVRHAGTNAIPVLLRLLRMRDSALKLKLINLAQRQQLIKIKHTAARDWNEVAVYSFGILRTDAQSAVPALVEIANQNISRDSRNLTIEALRYIGPPAEQAVPALLLWATNADWLTRANAIMALGDIHAEPHRVIPVLTNALHDTNSDVRYCAVTALEQFGQDAELAVVKLLNDPDYNVRDNATNALRRIDPEAAAKAGITN